MLSPVWASRQAWRSMRVSPEPVPSPRVALNTPSHTPATGPLPGPPAVFPCRVAQPPKVPTNSSDSDNGTDGDVVDADRHNGRLSSLRMGASFSSNSNNRRSRPPDAGVPAKRASGHRFSIGVSPAAPGGAGLSPGGLGWRLGQCGGSALPLAHAPRQQLVQLAFAVGQRVQLLPVPLVIGGQLAPQRRELPLQPRHLGLQGLHLALQLASLALAILGRRAGRLARGRSRRRRG